MKPDQGLLTGPTHRDKRRATLGQSLGFYLSKQQAMVMSPEKKLGRQGAKAGHLVPNWLPCDTLADDINETAECPRLAHRGDKCFELPIANQDYCPLKDKITATLQGLSGEEVSAQPCFSC